MTDEDGCEVRRQLVVRLYEATQILQVAVGEDATRPVGLEVGVQLCRIYAGNHRPFVRQRPRNRGKPRVPSAVAGKKESEMPNLAVRPENDHVLEAAVIDRFRTSRVPYGQQRERGGDRNECGDAYHDASTPQAAR